MNRDEYERMIDEVVNRLSRQVRQAARRNESKDIREWDEEGAPSVWVKGWTRFNLEPKLLEEFAEVLRAPREDEREIGDLVWVLAMMLDQKMEASL